MPNLRRISQVVLLAAFALTRAGAATPIRIGVPERDNLQYLTLWVALGAGDFEAEGLEPHLVVADAPYQSGQLLFQHRADIALLQPPVYLGMMAQGTPIVLFANLLANDAIDLVVRPDIVALRQLDPAAPLIERLRAMRGLRIGVGNEPPRRLRVLFALAGMDADRDIQMKIVGGRDQIDAFADGTVDALYTHTPFLEEALVNRGAVLIVNQSAGEVAPLSGGEIHSLAATREYAAANPATLRAASRAVARAESLLHRDPSAAARALVKAGLHSPTLTHLATIVGLYRSAVPATPKLSAAAVEHDALLYPARPTTPDFSRIRVADFLAPGF